MIRFDGDCIDTIWWCWNEVMNIIMTWDVGDYNGTRCWWLYWHDRYDGAYNDKSWWWRLNWHETMMIIMTSDGYEMVGGGGGMC